MDEIPERAKLWLDREVAAWLHQVAEERYEGNVEKAMNVMLKVAMIVHQNPEQPWAGVMFEDGTSRRYRARPAMPGSKGSAEPRA